VDISAGCNPHAAPLLVRRASPAAERDVAALFREVAMDPREVTELIRQRAVLVLSDLTMPRSAPPVAAAAFRFDRPAKAAQLVGIGVAGPVRRRGRGRRLLSGALMVLRAEGFERVQAWADRGGAAAALLVSAGFAADDDAARADGRTRFLLML
jgi:N-acetylglutamate synthase-like GNAT family acetyltransferase